MQFRTEITPAVSESLWQQTNSIYTAGSCFSDVLGSYLIKRKINCLSNALGNTYNPVSLWQQYLRILKNEQPVEQHFLMRDELILHHDYHSDLRAANQVNFKDRYRALAEQISQFLKKADHVVFTLGTAWIYELNGEIINNCHKKPQSSFTKRLLTLNEIIASFEEFYQLVKKINPNVKIILTLSPVRHIKDTLELNAVSKALLRYAIFLCQDLHSDVAYFPSYEIMNDDLRDYRFYKKDLIHTNEMAEEYILLKFAEAYFSDELKCWNQKIEKINNSLVHKAFNKEIAGHTKFLENLKSQIQVLQHQADFSKELAWIDQELQNKTKA